VLYSEEEAEFDRQVFTHVIEERLEVRLESFRNLYRNIIFAHRLSTNTRRLIARQTVFLYGVSCYFQINYCMPFNIVIRVGSHRRSRNRRMTVGFTGHS